MAGCRRRLVGVVETALARAFALAAEAVRPRARERDARWTCDDRFKSVVFLDRELWEHFGSEERVLEALRLLVSVAEKGTRSVA